MGFVFIRVNLNPEKSLNQFGAGNLPSSVYSYGGRGLKPVMTSSSTISWAAICTTGITWARTLLSWANDATVISIRTITRVNIHVDLAPLFAAPVSDWSCMLSLSGNGINYSTQTVTNYNSFLLKVNKQSKPEKIFRYLFYFYFYFPPPKPLPALGRTVSKGWIFF